MATAAGLEVKVASQRREGVSLTSGRLRLAVEARPAMPDPWEAITGEALLAWPCAANQLCLFID
jgi:hypothetical protein